VPAGIAEACRRHGRRGDEARRLGVEEIDERVVEPEDRGIVVLEGDRQPESLLVEGLRRLQILHEQRLSVVLILWLVVLVLAFVLVLALGAPGG